MKKRSATFLFAAVLVLVSNGCGTNPTSVITPSALAETSMQPTPMITPIPEGKTIVVTSAENSGPGTLRQALLDAQTGDTITFDENVFPPDNPTTIFLDNEGQDQALPEITQGYLTIDASNAGVVLDGSQTRGEWINGLSIRSDGNVIRGLQMVNLRGSAVHIWDGAQNNVIGGDRTIGRGPVGQGNLSSDNWAGMSMQGEGTSFNTMTGNLIGTDVDGISERGNGEHEAGIYVANGASNNRIGPDNIIAYNNIGVQIDKPTAFGNIITQNSIYDNRIGIFLSGEGNAYMDPPSIVGFDIADGIATIFTCPDCAVELFSDSENQGRYYEGQGQADRDGVLTINKGASCAGPYLTAVAIDPNGNTSVFSLPTTGMEKSAITLSKSAALLLQGENTNPRNELKSKPSGELMDNKIGTFSGSSLWHPVREPEVFPEGLLDTRYILEMGFKRFRFGINSLDVGGADWSKPELTIDPSHDEFVTTLAKDGVKLTYNLTFWDTAYKAQGGQVPALRFKTEEDIQHYLDYVRFIVSHFKDRVEYYEIWNEPNVPHNIQRIEVDEYINLIKRAAPVIHQEYPQAKVQVGSTTNIGDPNSQAFLFQILNSDTMPLVDVVSWHMEAGYSPDDPHKPEFYYQYPDLIQKIKETAAAHGFEGEFEVDEIHWPTPGHPEGNLIHSNIQSVKYLIRSIMMHRGMDMTVTQLLLTGGMQLHKTNGYLNTVMSGAEPTSLPVEIQSDANNITSFSFSLPNGDKLLAVWNDNIAVDYDPGIQSTLTIPGFADWNATAIDVLNGFEQELVSTSENGNLVIRDFLLKDYPIIIRLSR